MIFHSMMTSRYVRQVAGATCRPEVGATRVNRSPSQNVVGSFFPSWILCLGAGITIAAASRVILVAVRFDKYVFAPPLAYLAVAVAATVFTWLYRFGQ